MATEFLFNVNQTRNISKKLIQKANKLNAARGDLTAQINRVASWWEGESEAAFIQQYKSFEPSLEQLETLATTLAKQLNQISDIKMENEKRRSNMFK